MTLSQPQEFLINMRGWATKLCWWLQAQQRPSAFSFLLGSSVGKWKFETVSSKAGSSKERYILVWPTLEWFWGVLPSAIQWAMGTFPVPCTLQTVGYKMPEKRICIYPSLRFIIHIRHIKCPKSPAKLEQSCLTMLEQYVLNLLSTEPFIHITPFSILSSIHKQIMTHWQGPLDSPQTKLEPCHRPHLVTVCGVPREWADVGIGGWDTWPQTPPQPRPFTMGAGGQGVSGDKGCLRIWGRQHGDSRGSESVTSQVIQKQAKRNEGPVVGKFLLLAGDILVTQNRCFQWLMPLRVQ